MFGCIQDTLVVVVDNLFSVIHATVTDLDSIAVEDFSEFVLFREVFAGADLGGGCRGCAPPPPKMTCGFLIQLVFCEKKNHVVYWC